MNLGIFLSLSFLLLFSACTQTSISKEFSSENEAAAGSFNTMGLQNNSFENAELKTALFSIQTAQTNYIIEQENIHTGQSIKVPSAALLYVHIKDNNPDISVSETDTPVSNYDLSCATQHFSYSAQASSRKKYTITLPKGDSCKMYIYPNNPSSAPFFQDLHSIEDKTKLEVLLKQSTRTLSGTIATGSLPSSYFQVFITQDTEESDKRISNIVQPDTTGAFELQVAENLPIETSQNIFSLHIEASEEGLSSGQVIPSYTKQFRSLENTIYFSPVFSELGLQEGKLQILDENGEPLSKAFVYLYSKLPNMCDSQAEDCIANISTQTNEEGFLETQLLAADYAVLVKTEERHFFVPQLTIETAATKVLQIPSAHQVRLFLVDHQGMNIEGAQVILRAKVPKQYRKWVKNIPLSHEATSSQDGQIISFANDSHLTLDAGKYTLTIIPPHGSYYPISSAQISIKENETSFTLTLPRPKILSLNLLSENEEALPTVPVQISQEGIPLAEGASDMAGKLVFYLTDEEALVSAR